MVTIKDLAKIANVSPSTVSNVIHGRVNKVSKETKEKIEKAIKETNYVSNMGGRLLAQHGSKIIGVIMTYARRVEGHVMNYPFYSEIIGALEEQIRKSGYFMMLYTSGSIDESLRLSRAWNIEGLIVLGNTPDEAERFFGESIVPIVFIDTYGKNIPNVGINDKTSMKGLVRYLIELGHKKIAFLSDSEVLIGVDAERYQGYEDAMEEAGILDEGGLIHISFREAIRKAMLKELLLNDFNGYTALCFASDYYAVEAMSYLSALHAKIPEDISITGFDNDILAKMATPKLTTVNQNVDEKGKTAVIELLKMVEREEKAIIQKYLPTQLIEGQSTRYVLGSIH